VSGVINQMRRNDLRGGLESALQGASTLVTPSLLFMGILGSIAAAPSLWGTLLAITLVPAVRLWLGGSAMVIAAPRSASTATYVALVLHMGLAASGSPVGDSNTLLTASQLRLGLAVASLMYLFASLLVTLSGVIKLGRVFKMIPNPVTSGISNGTAMLLLMLAVNKVTEGGLPTALTAVVMVLASFGWSWVQQKHSAYANQIPAILLALAMGYAGSAVLGDAQHTAISGPSDGILSTQWLSFNLWKSLDTGHLGALLMLAVPGTITLALVMVLETFTTSSTMEIRFGVRSHADRELIALGCANMLGAVLGGLPCTGSSIYSVSSWLSGGRSKLASWACYGLSGLMMLCFTPWLILTVFVFVWGLPPVKAFLNSLFAPAFPMEGLHNMVEKVAPVVSKPTKEGAVYTLNLLSSTGTGILLAAIVGAVVMKYKVTEIVTTFFRTLWLVRYSLATIVLMLGLGTLTRYSGTDTTLGLAFANTGVLYPFFGTLMGWIGVAMTGSDTASNVLFGGMQKVAAEQLGLSPNLMGAANSSGGVMGKMIDAQSIVVASTATRWFNHEGDILRYVFFHSIALACLVGIFVTLQAYVFPFTAMVIR
jgi:hypothetical protein